MPLRDHFRPPVNDRHTWDELHGGWPMMIVRDLHGLLPAGYSAAPNVHLGRGFEVDVTAFEEDGPRKVEVVRSPGDGGAATLVLPEPTLTLETELPDDDTYEVRIYDTTRGRRLVAAIEVVSPSNKDRPASRRASVGKVGSLLREGVSVSIVDLVTIRRVNLYAELLEQIGATDPALDPTPEETYAVTLRSRTSPDAHRQLDIWYEPMAIGKVLPTLPIWIDTSVRVMLPLEPSYEETCRFLRIR